MSQVAHRHHPSVIACVEILSTGQKMMLDCGHS
jgi:hypothetical protein